MSEKSFAQRDNADFSPKQSTAKSASQAITSNSQTSSEINKYNILELRALGFVISQEKNRFLYMVYD
jgi:hypothetical protein